LLVSGLYIGLLWNKTDGLLGQPIRAVRTLTGQPVSDRDQSSDLYRQNEEFDIWATIRESPLTGVGFGKPFNQYIPLVRLGNWEFQYFTPHNQVFWLWLKMGALGFIVSLWLFGVAITRTVQLMVADGVDEFKPFILLTLCYTIMLLTFGYVDIVFANGRAMLLLGCLLGVTGNLPALLGRTAATAERAPGRQPAERSVVAEPALTR
jgi:O-antigen ligase